MNHYIGNRAKIHIKRDGINLFFDATILDINQYLISFRDKYNNDYSFKISEIIEIRGETSND
jgi:hypothetical protein